MQYQKTILKAEPSQSTWELNTLLEIVAPHQPGYILEIGVHRGGSLRVWEEVFKPTLMIGIDTHILEDAKQGNSAILIEGNSQDDQVLSEVISRLGYHNLDFVFIDGSHYYKDVKADYETYKRIVRPGGIIAFHDVVLEGNDTCDVYKFWQEIRQNNKTITIWDGSPSGTGTGIIYL